MNTKNIYFLGAGIIAVALAILLFRGCGEDKNLSKNLLEAEQSLLKSQENYSNLDSVLNSQIEDNKVLVNENEGLVKLLKSAHSKTRTITKYHTVIDSVYFCPDKITQRDIDRITATKNRELAIARNQVKEKQKIIDDLLQQNAGLIAEDNLNKLPKAFEKTYPLPNLNKVAKITFTYQGSLISQPNLSLSDLRQVVEEKKKEKKVHNQFLIASIGSFLNNEGTQTEYLNYGGLGYGILLGNRIILGLEVNSDFDFKNVGGEFKLGYRFSTK